MTAKWNNPVIFDLIQIGYEIGAPEFDEACRIFTERGGAIDEGDIETLRAEFLEEFEQE